MNNAALPAVSRPAISPVRGRKPQPLGRLPYLRPGLKRRAFAYCHASSIVRAVAHLFFYPVCTVRPIRVGHFFD